MFFNELYKVTIDFITRKIIERDKTISLSPSATKEEKDKYFEDLIKDIDSWKKSFVSNIESFEKTGKVFSQEEIIDIVTKSEKIIKSQGLADDNPKPKITTFSKEEIESRKHLSDNMREGFYNNVFDFTTEAIIARKYHQGHKLFERTTEAIIQNYDINKVNDTIHLRDILNNPTNENYAERKQILTDRIMNCIKTAKDFSSKMSDADFVKNYGTKIGEIFELTELQEGNIKDFMKDFGVELDPDTVQKWKEAAPLFVQIGGLINRYSNIANPQYATLSPNDALNVHGYIGLATEENVDFSEEVGYNPNAFFESLKSFDKLEASKNNPEEFQKEVSQNINILGDYAKSSAMSKDGYIMNCLNITIKTKLKSDFNLSEEDMEFKNVNGENITLNEAIKNNYTKNNVFGCYNKEGKLLMYIGKDDLDKEYPSINTEEKVGKVDIENASDKELKDKFDELGKMVDKTTHWYLRSSNEYREFRKTLNSIIKSDYSDRAQLKEKMVKLQDNAMKYLAIKEKPNVKINNNTIARINACDAILNFTTASLNNSIAPEKSLNNDGEVYASKEEQAEFTSGLDKIFEKTEIDKISKAELEEFSNTMKNENSNEMDSNSNN